MSMDLRPLTLGELLDRAFMLYRRHLWVFVGLMAIPSVLALAVNILIEVANRWTTQDAGLDAGDPARVLLVAVGMIGGGLLLFAAQFVVYSISLGAATLAVADVYQGRTPSIADVYRRVRPHIGRLILLMLLFALAIGGLVAVGGGLTVLLVAGATVVSPILGAAVLVPCLAGLFAVAMFLVLRWALSVPAAVLEARGAADALRRSIVLTRGRLGRVLLLIVLGTVVTYAAVALLQGPFMVMTFMAGPESRAGFWLSLGGSVAGTVGAAFAGPIVVIGSALLYYDARIREEGLDLQLMLAALEGTPRASHVTNA